MRPPLPLLHRIRLAVFSISLAALLASNCSAYEQKIGRLSTQWDSQVSPENVLPEYPRPQMVRPRWLNLNGLWEYSAAAKDEAVPAGKKLSEEILVPFVVESPLSGLMRHEERMWYLRSFTVPSDWKGQHVMLHFGAVDYLTTVYLNGKEVGKHQGGYCAFSFDITPFLKAGANELIVNVYDATDVTDHYQAVGKQSLKPRGYWYTASSGIWQTVWLEPVPAAHITRLNLTPDVPKGILRVAVQGDGLEGRTVEVAASSEGKPVSKASGLAGQDLELSIPNARLWSPDDPFLYDLKVSVKEGKNVVDTVSSYAAMRSLSKGVVGGILRPLLNGKFVFQQGTLDQGWWPDGLYTAPTDEALKFDIEQTKKCGFNTIRKHIKVEPARWYYWCDKLGVMVWQDMPSMMNETVGPDGSISKGRPDAPPEWRQQFEAEFKEEIDQLRSSPSVVGWILFNEGWGQFHNTKEVTALGERIKAHDPTRFLAVQTAAGPASNGDVLDWHVYPGPGSPPPLAQRFAGAGEWGGMGCVIKDHSWTPVNRDQDTAAKYTARYVSMVGRLKEFLYSPGLSYAFFTQITDVEGERNGFFTYDRAVFKGEMEKIRAAHDDLVAASKLVGQPYTEHLEGDFSKPEAWSVRSGTWKAEKGGYAAATPGIVLAASHFNNFSAELDLMVPASGEAGLLFRCGGEGDQITGYAASISPSALSLSYAEHGTWTSITSAPLHLTPGAPCHMKVVGFGGTIRCYLDSQSGPVLEATDYRQLVGAMGLRAAGADSQFGCLSVSNPFVRLRPINEAGFIIHNSKDNLRRDVTQFHTNVNRDDDALWQLKPGLADAKGVSFESARVPGWFLRDQNGIIVYAKADGTPEFNREATWLSRPGLASSAGVKNHSYESLDHPGEFLRLGRPMERKPVQTEGQKIAATFEEMR